jgi:anti-sigma B factor antagonist
MAQAFVDAGGEIDTATADELKSRIYAAIDANPGATVTIDFSTNTFLDSTGLGVLVASLKHARSLDGDIELANVPPRMAKILGVTGLDKVFGVATD